MFACCKNREPFLEQHNIQVLLWPVRSPDLSLIGLDWNMLKGNDHLIRRIRIDDELLQT